MSEELTPNESEYRAALKRARDTIAELMRENASLRGRDDIAITGMACRFPGGADDVAGYWRLLDEGEDGISDIGDNRWRTGQFFSADRDLPGKMYTLKAGLLSDAVDRFDARFFGVSQKEAVSLDPQQRLLMELSWQVLEDAGIIPATLEGSKTGVFVGLSGDDYARMHRHSGDEQQVDAYSLIGTTMSTASGRLAYHYGFRGPCLTLDTACSSSLVALHLAAKSIRDGECDRALVGASNLILMPENHIAFCKMGALSPEGKCRTFDAGANGYVRSEGVGFVLLEKLDTVRREKRRPYGIVSGSAINQDGKTAGLSAPNGQAQQDVIRAALEDAQFSLGDIDYVEAHGTGTVLGDPIELEALASVADSNRDAPLLIGSAKSNIGHMEPTAGLGGLIKILLALQHEKIPGNLHFSQPNPHISWGDIPMRVVDASVPWPKAADRIRRAGLSAFGFSGTNAHIIVSEVVTEPPVPREDPVAERVAEGGVHLLRLSARSQDSLNGLSRKYLRFLNDTTSMVGDICASAWARRAAFGTQLAVAGSTTSQLADRLSDFLEGAVDAPGIRTGDQCGQAAWLFTGQGAQYPRMGRELYDSDAIFRGAIDRCAAILETGGGLDLRDILLADDSEQIHNTAWTQPALFAFEYALAERWLAWGYRPAAVMGHSIGEYVAACVAGVMSLEQALPLVALRGRLMGGLPAGGGMAAVAAAEADVRALLGIGAGDTAIDIAAVNAPRETVIAGPIADIDAAVGVCAQQGLRCTRLTVSHGFHSRLMAPVLPEFRQAVARVAMRPASIPMILNTTGELAPDGTIDPEYWVQQIVGAVQFQRGLDALGELGIAGCLEIGPQPILSALVKAGTEASLQAVSSLRRGRPANECLARAQEQLFALGVEPRWSERYSGYEFCDLPVYAFAGQSYWHQGGYPTALRQSLPAPGPVAVETANACSRLDLVWVREHLLPLEEHHQCLLLGDEWPTLASELERAGCRTSTAPGWGAVAEEKAVNAPTVIVVVDHLLLDVDTMAQRLRYVSDLARTLGSRPEPGALWLVGSRRSEQGPVALDLYRGAITSLLLDYPQLHGGVVEVERNAADRIAALLDHRTDSTWLRLNADGLFAGRLTESPAAVDPEPAPTPAVAVITGGLGGIGLALARELGDRGSQHLVLLGRRVPGEAAAETVAELRRTGIEVETLSCDIAGADSVEVLRGLFTRHPNAAVFHAAGVMPDNPDRDYEQALAAKVGGALHLLQALEGMPSVTLVLLGSISAVLGTPALSAYSAANGALSAIARWYQQRGGKASCINWGSWQDGDIMQADRRAQAESSGFTPLATAAALDALNALPEGADDYSCVACADWRRVAATFALRRHPALLSDFLQDAATAGAPATSEAPKLVQALTSLPLAQRKRRLIQHLAECLTSALGLMDNETPAPDRGFFDLGLDSLKALELREAIEQLIGLRLEAADIFDYPTLDSLSDYLLQSLNLDSAGVAQATGHPETLETPPAAASSDGIDSAAGLTDEELERLIDREFGASLEGENP